MTANLDNSPLERGAHSAMLPSDEIDHPASPALICAHETAARVARVGFDWPDVHGVLAKVEEELAELREAIASGDPAALDHEYGDLLMAVASVGRHLGLEPEPSLGRANQRFARRFARLEANAALRGLRLEEADAAALDALWVESKRQLQADEHPPGPDGVVAAPSPPRSA